MAGSSKAPNLPVFVLHASLKAVQDWLKNHYSEIITCRYTAKNLTLNNKTGKSTGCFLLIKILKPILSVSHVKYKTGLNWKLQGKILAAQANLDQIIKLLNYYFQGQEWFSQSSEM